MPSSAEKEAINKQTNPSRGSSISSTSGSILIGNPSRTKSDSSSELEGAKHQGTPDTKTKDSRVNTKSSQARPEVADAQSMLPMGGFDGVADIRAQIIANGVILFPQVGRCLPKSEALHILTSRAKSADCFEVIVLFEPRLRTNRGSIEPQHQARLVYLYGATEKATVAAQGPWKADARAALNGLLITTARVLKDRQDAAMTHIHVDDAEFPDCGGTVSRLLASWTEEERKYYGPVGDKGGRPPKP